METPIPLLVLSSEQELSPDSTEKCFDYHCRKLATKVWPTVSKNPRYYCDEHLEEAKYKLQVALAWADNRPEKV